MGSNNHVDTELDSYIEQIILKLSDAFEITQTCLLSSTRTFACVGRQVGAALGAGTEAATRLKIASFVSLQKICISVREKLKRMSSMLLNIVFCVHRYLQTLDRTNYIRAVRILMNSYAAQMELIQMILDSMTRTLRRQVSCNVAA